MNTLHRTHYNVARFLIASIWVMVCASNLAGLGSVKGNIQNTLTKHENARNSRRSPRVVLFD